MNNIEHNISIMYHSNETIHLHVPKTLEPKHSIISLACQNKRREQHILKSEQFPCSGDARSILPAWIFLFGLPSLLCPLSEHLSFLQPCLMLIPAYVTWQPPTVLLKPHGRHRFFVSTNNTSPHTRRQTDTNKLTDRRHRPTERRRRSRERAREGDQEREGDTEIKSRGLETPEHTCVSPRARP